jgi:hypothetical protein
MGRYGKVDLLSYLTKKKDKWLVLARGIFTVKPEQLLFPGE